VVLGLAGSVAAGRMLAQQVWRVSAFDPIAFTIVSTLLLTAGLMACAWPALRAARIDPIVGLRQD
jgi:ABC-type antimicrobial peptide transport system permease subunit